MSEASWNLPTIIVDSLGDMHKLLNLSTNSFLGITANSKRKQLNGIQTVI